jgi:mRNA guanylyltransferase
MPDFLLYTWLGQEEYEYYDSMDVEPEEWEQ